MPSNKDRVYVALFARAGAPKMPGLEDTHHWALIVAPKLENIETRGVQYHAKEKILGPSNSQRVYEEIDISLRAANMLLVRIAVAKIVKPDSVHEVLRSTPIRQGEAGWNCVKWVKEALQLLEVDGETPGYTCRRVGKGSGCCRVIL